MSFTTLINPEELGRHLDDDGWAIIDCRFSLDDTERGIHAYLDSHIQGATYAHLDNDLSGKKVPGITGRHPLPEISAFTDTLSGWGIDEKTQVVVYDDSGGAMAARLWWLLKWMGHENVALLNGGWVSWTQLGLPQNSEAVHRKSRRFTPREVPGAYLRAEQVQACMHEPGWVILDARSAPRFRGEVEPIDAVAGHIPGAISSPFEENLGPDGKFLAPEILRRRFEMLLKSVPTENVICYCGSGVTAAHNIIAIAYAGLGMSRLYGGSWSEWITDPSRPIATGTH